MLRRAALILALFSPPLQAQEAPNLLPASEGTAGAASRLILAQRAQTEAMRRGDPVLLLSAIRLAREVTQRPPTSWTRETEDRGPAEGADEAALPLDPAGDGALSILKGLATEDPDLQDLVYDLDAQLPHGRRPTATVTEAWLDGGQTDRWQMPLFGALPAEIGVVGNGDSPLGLTVTDESGAIVCAQPADATAGLCRFTPARNGFFSVAVRNAGDSRAGYRLVGN